MSDRVYRVPPPTSAPPPPPPPPPCNPHDWRSAGMRGDNIVLYCTRCASVRTEVIP